MIRTQIQLTKEQSTRLKVAAARRGMSVAAFIRQSVEAELSRSDERSLDDLYLRAARAAGRHRSGKRDVSKHHDEYLSGAYAE